MYNDSMHYTHKDLARHLQKEHNISPFSTYLQEIVYGGNDGIVTTFAVVAGFAGANASEANGLGYLTVLLFGLANLFADGTSMGLGNLLSIRAEQDRYRIERTKEEHEIQNNVQMEKAETKELLLAKGFSQEQAEDLVKIYSTNIEYWADFMMRYELEISDTTSENPWFTGLATFISFMSFGFIPLIPYILFQDDINTFWYATLFTVMALLLLGVLRFIITKQSLFRSVFEVLLIGGLSASVAFVVGTFFK